MINNQFSLILLPTNECNVACDYCFEDKTAGFITHDQLSLTIKSEWFERAHELISEAASRKGKKIDHSLQSNMIRYSAKWTRSSPRCAATVSAPRWTFPTCIAKHADMHLRSTRVFGRAKRCFREWKTLATELSRARLCAASPFCKHVVVRLKGE